MVTFTLNISSIFGGEFLGISIISSIMYLYQIQINSKNLHPFIDLWMRIV